MKGKPSQATKRNTLQLRTVPALEMDELIAEEVFAGTGEAVMNATFIPAHYSTLHIFHFASFPDAWLSLKLCWNIFSNFL